MSIQMVSASGPTTTWMTVPAFITPGAPRPALSAESLTSSRPHHGAQPCDAGLDLTMLSARRVRR